MSLPGADIYGGTYRLLHKVANRAGIGVTLVDSTDLRQRRAAAITPATKLVWIESPGNPLMSITDIAACAEVAHRGAGTAWASTTRSPRPCSRGRWSWGPTS